MKPFYEYLMSFDDYKMKPLRGNPSIKTKVLILICERSELSEAKRRRRHDRRSLSVTKFCDSKMKWSEASRMPRSIDR